MVFSCFFLSGHNHSIQRFCKLVTARGRSRTPVCVSLGWGCVPIGIELFANMIYVGRTTISESSHCSQPAAVRQVKLSSDFWGSSLYAFHFAESPTSVPVLANREFLLYQKRWKVKVALSLCFWSKLVQRQHPPVATRVAPLSSFPRTYAQQLSIKAPSPGTEFASVRTLSPWILCICWQDVS